MKTKMIVLTVLFLSLFVTGCERNQGDALILIKDNMEEMIFVEGDSSAKSLTISSNVEWNASFEDGSWLNVSPDSGKSGEHKVMISLKDGLSEKERTDRIIFTAGSSEVSMKIIQRASASENRGPAIVASQRRIPVGAQMMLSVVDEKGKTVSSVDFTSSEPAVASVDASGKLSALSIGKTVITAQAKAFKAELEMEVTDGFVTDGLGRKYTFEDLAKLVGSGVEYERKGASLTSNVRIAEKDILSLGDAETVSFDSGVILFINGTADMAAESDVEFETVDGAEKDGQIHFSGEVDGGGIISGIDFIGVTVRSFGSKSLTIRKCRFTGIESLDPAVSLGSRVTVTVSDCEFIENAECAIAGAANIPSPVVFENNVVFKNCQKVMNRPQVNLTVGAEGEVVVRNNKVTGPAEITMNGGIGISNMMNIEGGNKVLLEGNEVKDCRFGITLMGGMDAVLKNNVLKDNKYEENPMNGGSGVSIYHVNTPVRVYMSGNTITGHFWGVTNISMKPGEGPALNMGNLAEGKDYNPGGNVFNDNGYDGMLYDLYNNSAATVYAQGNYWNVDVQDEESIESVIFHKNDQADLGEVIFMPAGK